MMRRRCLWIGLIVAIGSVASSCARSEPQTDAARRARGRELIERMGTHLASAKSVAVTTREIGERTEADGSVSLVTLTRDTVIQRPDRLYFKTTGDRNNEGWYDGTALTLVIHADRVFGQARMPETLDGLFEAVHDRYGIHTPLGDFLRSSPAKALLPDTTSGGWLAREMIDGLAVDHLSYKDPQVSWDLWLLSRGQPLPKRLVVEYVDDPRQRKLEVLFNSWNLAPETQDDRFLPSVPADYEAIPIVQGASAMKNRPPEDARTMVVGGTIYWYSSGTYYTRAISGGAVAYQVVPPPAGR
jgi:hypothetical protein